MGGAISPDHILREMAELWVSLGKQSEGDDGAGVLRACSMTLVVAAEEADDAQAIGETIAALMPEYPSRAIVIRFREGAERALAARVFAQCWMPFGHRRQICCEQIEIAASDAGLPDLAAVVLPLAVPDLPVILWCRSARLFHLPAFPQLAAIAHKVVLDSCAFAAPAAILKVMAETLAAGRSLADLSWTRLTRWRELISQIFENRVQLASLPSVTQIRVSHPGRIPTVPAYYMAAWLMDGLANLGAQPRLRFDPASEETSRQLTGVDLLAGDASRAVASIALVEGHAAEVRAGDLINCALLPPPTDYSLMREELAIPGRDPVFEKTLAAAARLALS